MTDTFLSRWSRRKDDARRAAREDATPDQPPSAAESAALTEEEVAALPKIESLTAESDITAFMRPGVPAALRKAALRRAWLVDPDIRDFVGHARDYDYDWNAPGGAPGYGPLADGEVAALARRVFGDSEAKQPAESEPDAPGEQENEEKDHA